MYSGDINQDECTGCIGHLRGDFGPTGVQFWTTWFPRVNNERCTPAFKREFDELVNALRSDEYSILASRAAVTALKTRYPGCDFAGAFYEERGLRIDTEDFIYLLRCNDARGDYNFYLYCYEKKCLSRHMGTPVAVDIAALRTKDPADISLEDLQFSVRTYNLLAHANIRTAQDIQLLQDRDALLRIRAMNNTLADEVVTALEELGLDCSHLKEVSENG